MCMSVENNRHANVLFEHKRVTLFLNFISKVLKIEVACRSGEERRGGDFTHAKREYQSNLDVAGVR